MTDQASGDAFLRRLYESRQQTAANANRKRQQVSDEVCRRRQFFLPVYVILDQLRTARVVFPAGAPPTSTYVKDMVEKTATTPRVVIPINTSLQLEITLSGERDLQFSASVCSSGWFAGKINTEDHIETDDVNQLTGWVADATARYEVTSSLAPTLPEPVNPPITDGAGRTRRIELE